MKRRRLAKTDIFLPILGIGTDWKGAHNAALGGKILVEAYKRGFNFWDTADSYGTHCHLREAFKSVPREKVIVSTKVSSTDYEEAKADVKKCLRELRTDYIDILLLHGIDSEAEFKSCQDAWLFLIEAKRRKIARAIGVSTHTPTVVNFMASKSKAVSDVDVVFTTVNRIGYQIYGSTLNDQLNAIRKLSKAGKSVVAMKVFGEGYPALLANKEASLAFVASLPISSLLVGIRNIHELLEDINLVKRVCQKSVS